MIYKNIIWNLLNIEHKNYKQKNCDVVFEKNSCLKFFLRKKFIFIFLDKLKNIVDV